MSQKLSISKAQFFYFILATFLTIQKQIKIVPTKTNNDNTQNYSSLLKNLENIKAEFVTLREYVG